MDDERVTITNRNKAVFTVRPVWVTNGRRSAVIAMLGSFLRMLQFRLGMDGPCRSTKQGGLSDFVSHTMLPLFQQTDVGKIPAKVKH